MKSSIILIILVISNTIMGQNDFFGLYEKFDFDVSSSILIDENNNYLIGASSKSQFGESYDFLFLTIDSLNGEILEEKYIGHIDSLELLHSMQFTSEGGSIVGATITINGYYNPYLLKLDQEENREWSLSLPNYGAQLDGYSAIQLHNDKYLILGSRDINSFEKTYVYMVSEDGLLESIDSINFRANQVIQSQDSSLVFIGQKNIDEDNSLIFVSKVSTQLDPIWSQSYGDSLGNDSGQSIAELDNGSFMLACNSDEMIFDVQIGTQIIKIDSEGLIEYISGVYSGQPSFINKGKSNKLALSSSYSYYNEFNNIEYRTYSYLLNQNGQTECLNISEGEFSKYSTNTIISKTGSILMTGGIKIFPNQVTDIFITKFNSNCDLIIDTYEIHPKNNIIVYPNPTREYLNIENIPSFSRIEIYSQIGERLFILSTENKSEKIDLRFLTPGIYFIKLNCKYEIALFKVMKN